MICFEVYRNGEYVCTAGIEGFGMLTVGVGRMAHHPETLEKFATAGSPQPAEQISLSVMGNIDRGSVVRESHFWAHQELALGDEISVRVVERPDCDEPQLIPAPDPSALRRLARG
jgi:hypothetical protein